MKSDQLTGVEPLDVVEGMQLAHEEKPYTERLLIGVRCHAALNGRLYTGRGNTQRQAAWHLLESIARWQKEVEDCL